MSKAILKSVREAIKTEKFAEAIEMCESLLKDEPKNYMAYLLLGAAYQNSNKVEAAKNLCKAIEFSPTAPTVALQGLANCAPLVELPKIYEQLLELVPDKFSDYYDKLYAISSNSLVTQNCLEIFKKQAKSEDYMRRHLAMKFLARMCVAQNLSVNDDEEQLFEASLKIAYEDEQLDVHLLCCKRYLKLLYKQKQFKQCLFNAVHITELYPDDIYAYEWICKIYCENYATPAATDWWSMLKTPIHHYAQELQRLNENSGLAMLIKAIGAFGEQQFITSRDWLHRIQVVQPNYSVAIKLLARTQMELGAYELALELWQKLGDEADEQMLDYCQQRLNDQESNEEIDLDKANSLRNSGKSIETYDDLILLGRLQLREANHTEALTSFLRATRLRPYRAECFYYLGKIYYNTKDMARARKCLEKCINLNPRCEDAVSILSAIYQQLGEMDLNIALLLSTLKHIKNDNHSKQLLYKLGLHYLSVNKWDDAIQSFRNAIKLDVTCLNYWESLGDAYCERGSYNSAIRVFQKILELDSANSYAKLQIAVIKTTIRMYPEAIEDFDNLLAQQPDYLPGLKGAAEAHIGLAHNLKLEHRLVRCRKHLQLASNHLQRAFHSLKNNDMVWLWRLNANVFVQTALLPNSLANLSVMRDNEQVILNRKDLLQMATRFYTCALKIEQNTFLWYELALCAYYSAQYLPSEAGTHMELAQKACRLAIQAQSDRWYNWNFLGVINMHEAINNLPVAQHCFIQALEIDRKSYTSWTNLGVLYLILGDIKLANQAFQRAQQSSPIYPHAWIGQAMIAETILEEEEALDLFRHCQQFDLHVESAIGYAHWVCEILTNSDKSQQPHYKHAIENMHADIVALDAINWYSAITEDNASIPGLSFQGFLNVRQKLYRPAVRAYHDAAKRAAVGEERDKLYTNLGYLYLKLDQPLNAINAFNAVSKADFKPITGLALAYFRAGQHQEAYAVYQSVLKSVAGDEDNKAAMILVAMAAMVYASQGEADTKTILYQCILLKDSPIQALYSACALGILHHDTQLTETILSELKKHENNQTHCAHIAYLRAQYYVVNKQPRKALTYLLSRVHIFPSCVELRKVLANFLLENFAQMRQYQLSTSQIALSAIMLGHHSKQQKNSCVDDSESLMIASRALQPVNKVSAQKLMQRAVHLYPQNMNAWNALLKVQ